jgi:hypothetical protein
MKRLLALACALLFASPLLAQAAVKPVDQFTADQVIIVGGQTMSGKIYVDGGNLRTEMQAPGMPAPAVSIVNGARNTIWIIMPGNMYMERSIETSDDVSHAAWTRPEALEPIGREPIDGQVCEKFRIRSSADLFFYLSADGGAPVRLLSADGSIRIDWKNVKKGPQPAALFQLPAGATRLSLPGVLKWPGAR